MADYPSSRDDGFTADPYSDGRTVRMAVRRERIPSPSAVRSASTRQQDSVRHGGSRFLVGLLAGLVLGLVLVVAGVGAHALWLWRDPGAIVSAGSEVAATPPPAATVAVTDLAMNGGAAPPSQPIDDTNVRSLIANLQPKSDPLEDVGLQVDRIITRFDCAALSATLAADGQVTVAGFVSRPADVERLRRELSGIDQLSAVIADPVKVHAWPFCEALGLLQEYANGDRSAAPRIVPNANDNVYQDGDNLVITATATSLYDGFLYVDFIDAEGTVVHLLPSPERQDNAVRAGNGW